MLSDSIKIAPYDKSRWTAYGPQPDNGQYYKAPDGTLWHVDRVEGDYVHLWTINAWGVTQNQAVNVYQFKATWTESSVR